jgi:bifunctional oligoribonuclease and PAP phosphatase NrnA
MWSRFREIVAAAERFLLVSHVRPDCDALGSELAMAGVLESLGKQVRIVNGQATPPALRFLDAEQRIKAIGYDVPPEELGDVEVVIILDTSAWIQLGPMADVIRSLPAKRVVIDHHVSEDDLQAEMFKNTDAEATGRLVVEAADALGVELTPAIAAAALAALATDTGWFRFSSVRGDTLRLAGRLIDAGARPTQLYTQLYEQDTLARTTLRGRILARATTELSGRLIHTAALEEDFVATGAEPSDTEDVINQTLAVEGTEVAVIFVWLAAGGYKVSFRSRSQVDCSRIAARFDGGGHRAAAGATLAGSLDEVRVRVLDAVREAMR